MDRQIAERLIAAAIALDPLLGEIDRAISEISDEVERKAFIDNLGDVLRQVNEGFIIPVSRQYPDLAEED